MEWKHIHEKEMKFQCFPAQHFFCFVLSCLNITAQFFVIFEDVWVIWSSSSISINQGVLGNINTLFSALSFNFFTFLSKIPGDDHFYYTLSPNVVKFIRYLERSKVRRNVNLEFSVLQMRDHWNRSHHSLAWVSARRNGKKGIAHWREGCSCVLHSEK